VTTRTHFIRDSDVVDAGPQSFIVAPIEPLSWSGTSAHVSVIAVSGWVSETRARVLGADRTTWPTPFNEPSASKAEEVERLRDVISKACGLTRQDIASGIGVDRRSLSGFVSGEIQPTPERLALLRALADLATWTAERFGKRAREVLTAEGDEGRPLDLVAAGLTDVHGAVESAARAAGVIARAPVTIRHRKHGEPLYLHAREVWSGRAGLPTRAGVVRDPEVYEQDLAEAAVTSDARRRSRRRRKSI
jgi:transcriptional regulator with XRE-family HTH domain